MSLDRLSATILQSCFLKVEGASADVIANTLEQAWLSRHPWPTELVADRGREFMNEVPDMLRDDYGVFVKKITTRNPQANSMVERCHKTLSERVNSQRLVDKHSLPIRDGWRGLLSSLAFAMRATVHATNRATPSQLVFGRDHIHTVGFEADWLYIKARKQRRIFQNNMKENATRREHEHQVGDQVAVKQYKHRKFGSDHFHGPFEVEKACDNGTVKLRRDMNGNVQHQIWNIRNLKPHKA